ncbi:MAG: HNH endonuclease [Candidatus Subteraquimicrobiales bacterium]|nr:HNH endonuclease [Candidatus Subteraquimicrobiales bacterium]
MALTIEERIYQRQWRQKNLEKSRLASRNYYHRNSVVRNLYSTKYKQDHPEQTAAYHRKYRQEHPKQYCVYDQNRRAKIKDLSLATLQKVYEENIRRHGTLTCYLCLKPVEFGQDSIDHKIPISRGGNHQRDNLDVAHGICTSAKSTKTESEYREVLKCRKL